MQNYFNRHSGTKKRGQAIALEKKKSKGYYIGCWRGNEITPIHVRSTKMHGRD